MNFDPKISIEFAYFFQIYVTFIASLITGRIVGYLSDFNKSSLGKRRRFCVYGLIPYCIGAVVMIIHNFCFDHQINNDNIGYAFGMFFVVLLGETFLMIGKTMISVPFKAFLMENVETEHQNGINIFKVFMSGLGMTIAHFILSIVTGSLVRNNDSSLELTSSDINNETVELFNTLGYTCGGLSIVSTILVGISVCVFFFASKEQAFDGLKIKRTELKKSCCKMNGIRKYLKNESKLPILLIMIVSLFVYTIWYLISGFSELCMNNIFTQKMDIDIRIHFVTTISFFQGLSIILYAGICYLLRKYLKILLGVSILLSNIVIIPMIFASKLIEEKSEDEHKMITEHLSGIWISEFIPLALSSIFFVIIESYPYTLLHKLSNSKFYGITVGLLNIFTCGGYMIYSVVSYFINIVSLEADFGGISLLLLEFIIMLTCVFALFVTVPFLFIKEKDYPFNSGFPEEDNDDNDNYETEEVSLLKTSEYQELKTENMNEN